MQKRWLLEFWLNRWYNTNQAETMVEAFLAVLSLINIVLFPFVGESFCSSVISSQSVNFGFDKNQSVFSICILFAFL